MSGRKQPKRWQDIPSAEEWGRPGLSARGRTIAAAAIEALLADSSDHGVQAPDEVWRTRVVDDFDCSLGYLSWITRLALRMMLTLLEWLPLLVVGRWARMSRLDLEARITYLEALESHRWALLTMLFVATKVPMTLSAYEQGEPLRMTGYDRPTTSSRRQLAVIDENATGETR